MQEIAWGISLVLMLVIIGVFMFVVINSGQKVEYAPVQTRFYKVRSGLFWVMVAGFFVVTFSTIQGMPYAAKDLDTSTGEIQVIDVEGFQWYWKLSNSKVKVNRPVLFNVTSGDVNHGLGIYDESLTLLAQTQAMPDYINKLEYTFKKPGTYKILCMEYCGMAHHVMTAVIEVTSE